MSCMQDRQGVESCHNSLGSGGHDTPQHLIFKQGISRSFIFSKCGLQPLQPCPCPVGPNFSLLIIIHFFQFKLWEFDSTSTEYPQVDACLILIQQLSATVKGTNCFAYKAGYFDIPFQKHAVFWGQLLWVVTSVKSISWSPCWDKEYAQVTFFAYMQPGTQEIL